MNFDCVDIGFEAISFFKKRNSFLLKQQTPF